MKVDRDTCTVENLKRKIYYQSKIHPLNQLIKLGQVVCDNELQTLKELGIEETSLI